jgi:hypothetical protein
MDLRDGEVEAAIAASKLTRARLDQLKRRGSTRMSSIR